MTLEGPRRPLKLLQICINYGKITNNQCTIATYHEYDIIVSQECHKMAPRRQPFQ